jgi:carboxyl-terminal processing protease
MSQRNLMVLLAVPAVVVFTAFMMAKTTPPPDPEYKLVRTVVDVLADIDKNFYRQLTPEEKQKLVVDMINGGLQKLDPHSEYFDEARLKQFDADTKGVFGGIGAYLGIDPLTGILNIDRTIPESPAMEAGLLSGDLIVKIDGESTEPLRADEARGKVKGEPGTSVTLTIRRLGRESDFDVTLTRAVIQIHPVKGVRRGADGRWDYMVDAEHGIALIRLQEFSKSAAEEVKAALAAADAAGAKAVILDLRGNGGGLLQQAIDISDLFLAEGYIVHTRDRYKIGRDVKAKQDGTAWEVAAKRPMAVLLNRASASASEIVAAALQDNKRAVVVGERSFGKGSVQKPFESPDGKAALKITTELWFTPNEKNIHRWPDAKADAEWGVRPDAGFDVPLTSDEEIQMILHLREAEKGPKPDAPKPPDPKPMPPGADAPKPKFELPKLDPNFKDKVEQKAIEHLKKAIQG